jgi:hypothetical protein
MGHIYFKAFHNTLMLGCVGFAFGNSSFQNMSSGSRTKPITLKLKSFKMSIERLFIEVNDCRLNVRPGRLSKIMLAIDMSLCIENGDRESQFLSPNRVIIERCKNSS